MRAYIALALSGLLSACPKPPAPAVPVPAPVSSPEPLSVAQGKITARIYLDRAAGVEEAALSTLEIAPGASIPLHVHPKAAEILYLIEGEGELSFSSRRQKVGPGDAIYLPAGTPHGFTAGAAAVRAVQLYAPGGPEQRFRGGSSEGTVAPEASDTPDPGAAEIIPAEKTPDKELPSGVRVRSIMKEIAAGKSRLDLLVFTLPANSPPGTHDHDDVSELIYVIRGEGVAVLGGQELPVRGGTAYYTPRGVMAGLKTSQETEILVLVHRPSSPLAPR
jgi:quercetin dioxygenase-like cupin family protein